eukprot:2750156-Pleurochrysis_carterae.AAC.4
MCGYGYGCSTDSKPNLKRLVGEWGRTARSDSRAVCVSHVALPNFTERWERSGLSDPSRCGARPRAHARRAPGPSALSALPCPKPRDSPLLAPIAAKPLATRWISFRRRRLHSPQAHLRF